MPSISFPIRQKCQKLPNPHDNFSPPEFQPRLPASTGGGPGASPYRQPPTSACPRATICREASPAPPVSTRNPNKRSNPSIDILSLPPSLVGWSGGRRAMANANNGGNGEPDNAPQAGRWYNLGLGSSFKDDPSAKFCTLRYEFKPASIDKSQPASLNKNKDNRVTVEFSNNQPGKPKVTFEGSSEDYKENDGVLFFDGESFCLERLNRAVKRLRHVRMPGESAAIAAAVANASTSVNPSATGGTGVEARSSPLTRIGKSQPVSNFVVHSVPVEVERIDIGEQETPVVVESPNRPDEHPTQVRSPSSYKKMDEMEESFNLIFGKDDDADDYWQNEANGSTATEIDVHLPIQHGSDDEISDVDVSDNGGDRGPNAAEALRAEMNAEEDRQQTSSYSGSSGSGSRSSGSGSGSASSSSCSEASDDDSASSVGASSGGDVEI